MSPAPVLQTDHLTKRFGSRVALDGLDLSVQAGQVFGFLGKNGAGKTTTIRILLDLVRPSGGSAFLFGANPRRDRSVLRRVGALIEDAAFYPYLSGKGNLDLLSRISEGKSLPSERLLERVGLAERGNDKVRTYSTGMKQRLGIAAALLNDPELVILDEPINGLDPVGVVEMRQLIRDLADKEGKTVFLSSHSLGEVEQTCDRVGIIERGRLVREGTISELLAGREGHHEQRETVRIEVDSVAKAVAALDGNWQVREIQGECMVEVSAMRNQIPEIVGRLVANQVAIFSVTQHHVTLEEVFLSLVDKADSG